MENNICYSPRFLKRLEGLSQEIIDLTMKKVEIFKENPWHPSLRVHSLRGELKGYWSISINMQYRIIFDHKENGDTLFLSIGKHDIYRNL
ncbi:MAG: type II toxin-antitoxin system RelE/ParE family toxin [Candidatus Paceibacterota bacterium]|jgi:plasmid maintenance system killer protein